jgi:hypothetical protein
MQKIHREKNNLLKLFLLTKSNILFFNLANLRK